MTENIKKMTYVDALTTIEQYFQNADISEFPPKLADAINHISLQAAVCQEAAPLLSTTHQQALRQFHV